MSAGKYYLCIPIIQRGKGDPFVPDDFEQKTFTSKGFWFAEGCCFPEKNIWQVKI